MRDKNSAFEADSEPEGLGLDEGVRGGVTWVGAACRSRRRGREGYQSAPWGASVNALRDIGQRREGYRSGGWRIGLRRAGRGEGCAAGLLGLLRPWAVRRGASGGG